MTLNVKEVATENGELSNLAGLAANNKLSNGEKFDFLYLFGGREDMLCTENGRSGCVCEWVGSLVDTMYEKLFSIRNQLFNIAYRPVICELVGMDLTKCDTVSSEICKDDQNTINQGFPHLNKAVSSINKDIEVISPWLGSTIHATIHHKIHHKYQRLEDGYHPGNELSNLTAKAMVKKLCLGLGSNS